MAFGKRQLHPHPLAKEIDITTTLLQRSLIPMESFIAQRMAYKLGITREKHFLTGTGVNQPLGVFTASANGISTGRDVSTGNATTAFTYAGLVSAKMALKGGYQAGAAWIFHRNAVEILMKIVDGQGRPMWQPSMLQGQPDTLLGNPILMSEYVPNTYTTGLYAGILGDFSFYWIAEAMTFRIQRLNELLARTRQVGFIGVQEIDGMPVLEEAFVRVKLG
jgi:HK97 family phage major capsid protein